jgi:arabinose-5-phosphate isomerase
MKVLEEAKAVLEIEARGILGLIPKLGRAFEEAVEAIYQSSGRVIVTGIGKSGIVARKIVATLNSTGTPSLFLHPTEAIHGDLGMVTSADIVLSISNSGETRELTFMLSSLRHFGPRLIAFTGQVDSTLARQSDLVIDVGVEQEACPWGLVPTASTTAALAAGDALAVALIKRRQFNHRDFRRFHPGGTLGERLAVQVSEVMLTGDRIPSVTPEQPLGEAIREMDRKDLGTTLVVESGTGVLLGILTDGDLRRLLRHRLSLEGLPVRQAMTPNPKVLSPQALAVEALNLMEAHLITILPIVDEDGRILGILHLHDLLGRGEFKFR